MREKTNDNKEKLSKTTIQMTLLMYGINNTILRPL